MSPFYKIDHRTSCPLGPTQRILCCGIVLMSLLVWSRFGLHAAPPTGSGGQWLWVSEALGVTVLCFSHPCLPPLPATALPIRLHHRVILYPFPSLVTAGQVTLNNLCILRRGHVTHLPSPFSGAESLSLYKGTGLSVSLVASGHGIYILQR